jgi:uncharacterized membrane protein YeaQ/YmgE (transglycosylase-associated protein family)
MTWIINTILWFALGAIAGWLANKITRSGLSFQWSVVVGIIGAFFGGWLLNLLNLPFSIPILGGFNLLSLVTALIGAILLLAIVAFFRNPPWKQS